MDESQIDQAIETTERALARRLASIARATTLGEGEVDCISCGEEIPEARRVLVPNAKRCVLCQNRVERR